MTSNNRNLSRRTVLRNSAIVATGLSVGAGMTSGVSASRQGQGGVGFIHQQSYDALDDPDCFDSRFYFTEQIPQHIEVPPSCRGGENEQTFQGYKIHKDPETSCSTSSCDCSWLFVNRNRNVNTVADGDEIRQRVTNIHQPVPCHDETGDGSTMSGPVVRVTFAPDPQRGNGTGNGHGPP